jgi:hypothetical protein
MENLEVVQLDFGFECKPISEKEKTVRPTKKQRDDFVFDFMDCLTSPIIVYPSPWRDAVPKGLLKNITLSRLFCIMSGKKMASLTEVVAYIMPRTFESPLHSEWANIYTWCGLQYAGRFKSAHQKNDMAMAIKDIAPETLSDYEQSLLRDLRVWIYDKRRQALKEILQKNKISQSDGILDIQEKLF